MNVLVIAQYFPPDLGGSATRAYNLAKGLSLNGCKVTVVAAFPHYPLSIIPKECRCIPLKVEWMGKIKVIRRALAAVPQYPQGKIPKGCRWQPLKVEQVGRMRVLRTFILLLESKGFCTWK